MGAEPKGYPRTLLVDVDSQHGGWVVEQLNRAGFKTDLASGWPAGHGLLGFGSVYPACIVIADLEQPKHLEEARGTRTPTLNSIFRLRHAKAAALLTREWSKSWVQ
jgi:hypothetical protein